MGTSRNRHNRWSELPPNVVKILLLKPSSLGDILHALPAANLLRTRLEPCHLVWLVNRQYASLLDMVPGIDHTLLFERKRWARLSRWPEFIGFLARVRDQRFDVCLDLQGLLRTGIVARASGAPRRIGFRAAREGARFAYTEAIAVPEELPHAVDRNLHLVRTAFDVEGPAEWPTLTVPLSVQRDAEELLRETGMSDPLLAVVPASRWASKRFPPQFFASVLDHVYTRRADVIPWLVGTLGEAPTAELVRASCRHAKPVSLMGRTPLPVLTALVQRSAAVLANDSGPLHLATACRTPSVALFGPTDPRKTGPYGPDHTVFRGVCGQAPCFRPVCPQSEQYCTNLDPHQVADALLRAIDRVPADASAPGPALYSTMSCGRLEPEQDSQPRPAP